MTNEITNEEIQRLKKLAGSASAGPWYSQHHRVCDEEGVDICGVASTRGKYECERSNRDFIATANPAFILSLIAKVESLAADAERYRWLREPTSDVALVLDKRTDWVPEDETIPGIGGYYVYEYRAGEELDAAIDMAKEKA